MLPNYRRIMMQHWRRLLEETPSMSERFSVRTMAPGRLVLRATKVPHLSVFSVSTSLTDPLHPHPHPWSGMITPLYDFALVQRWQLSSIALRDIWSRPPTVKLGHHIADDAKYRFFQLHFGSTKPNILSQMLDEFLFAETKPRCFKGVRGGTSQSAPKREQFLARASTCKNILRALLVASDYAMLSTFSGF